MNKYFEIGELYWLFVSNFLHFFILPYGASIEKNYMIVDHITFKFLQIFLSFW